MDHEEFLKNLKKNRKKDLKELKSSINSLVEIVQNNNPLSILTILAFKVFENPETYSESESENKEPYVEYFQSLSMAFPHTNSEETSNPEIIKKSIDFIKQIFSQTSLYWMTEVSLKKKSKEEYLLRFQLMNHSLYVRGNSYIQHIEATFNELYSELDQTLNEKFGFKSYDVLELVDYFTNSIENKVDSVRDTLKLKEIGLRESLISLAQKNPNLTSEQIQDRFNSEFRLEIDEYLNSLITFGGFSTFEITPRSKTDKIILNLISAEFGDNQKFMKIPGNEGFPLNPSIINLKPIIKADKKNYCFNLSLFHRNIGRIVENIVAESEISLEPFYKKRGDYLEAKTLELFSNILKIPQTQMNANLYYKFDYEGLGVERYELDGLFEYGNYLFLVEPKAGKMSDSAYRGSLLSFQQSMDDLLTYGTLQGFRAKSFVEKNSPARFEDENGNVIKEVKIEDYKEIFVISAYFEPIGHIITHLNLMKKVGVVDTVKTWAVYLNDLRAISEINEHPLLFIDYLRRRLDLNLLEKFDKGDELDYYMAYLQMGLLFTDEELRPDSVVLHGFTEDLDSYYFYLEGKRSFVEKPKRKLPQRINLLFNKLENQKPDNFIPLAHFLLELCSDTLNSISDQIRNCDTKLIRDKRIHSFTIPFYDIGLILSFMHLPDRSQLDSYVNPWVTQQFGRNDVQKIFMVFWEFPFDSPSNKIMIINKEKEN